MDSLLPAWMKDLEDLKKMVAPCPYCGSLEPQHMVHASTFIIALIEQCRRLRPQARTQAERDASRAEEEGLRDALLERDHRHQYRDRPAAVFKRYAMGFEEGKALIRLACEDVHRTTSSNRTQVCIALVSVCLPLGCAVLLQDTKQQIQCTDRNGQILYTGPYNEESWNGYVVQVDNMTRAFYPKGMCH